MPAREHVLEHRLVLLAHRAPDVRRVPAGGLLSRAQGDVIVGGADTDFPPFPFINIGQ